MTNDRVMVNVKGSSAARSDGGYRVQHLACMRRELRMSSRNCVTIGSARVLVFACRNISICPICGDSAAGEVSPLISTYRLLMHHLQNEAA